MKGENIQAIKGVWINPNGTILLFRSLIVYKDSLLKSHFLIKHCIDKHLNSDYLLLLN